LCKDIPNVSSKFADEGTLAHTLASNLLSKKPSPWKQDDGSPFPMITNEMEEEVNKYVDLVHQFTGDGTLMVEKRVDYSSFIGVPDSFGTADAIIVSPDGEEVCCVDLKYGKGVRVDAEENPQLMLYCLGAINELDVIGAVKRVRMVIHQPRLDHVSEWDCTIEHLMEFSDGAMIAAAQAVGKIGEVCGPMLVAGEKQCRFCPAKATCPALQKYVQDNIGGGFEDITKEIPVPQNNDKLSIIMKAAPLIEDFLKAVRAKVESELLSGNPVKDFKLVEGRKGARAWVDKERVEALLKSFRLKVEEMFDLSLISPTTAEKVLKDNPKRWAKVEELITRKDGQPSVAPVTDKRPAISLTNAKDGFDDESGTEFVKELATTAIVNTLAGKQTVVDKAVMKTLNKGE
jgi:hypothetical protein